MRIPRTEQPTFNKDLGAAMEMIQSGTTVARILRAALVLAMTGGFAAAFLFDGFFGYPRLNAMALAESLALPLETMPHINAQLTAEMAEAIRSRVGVGDPLTALTDDLGDPDLHHNKDVYYLGPGGHLRATVDRGRIRELGWVGGRKSESELRWQQYLGFALSVVALASLVRLILLLTMRVTISSQGLKLPGRRMIGFDAMTALKSEEKPSFGRLVLEYDVGGGSRTVTLDRYAIAAWEPIVTALCDRKGFTRPPLGKT